MSDCREEERAVRKKYGWTALGMVGFVFAPIGLLFTVLGILLGRSGAVRWKSSRDPAVFLAVFAGVGGLFLLLGLGFLLADIRRRCLLRRAFEGGERVDAEIIGMVTQRNVNMVNGSPRMLECAWTDASGVVHIYRSRYLYTDVTKFLTSKTVPVYIDRFNENIGFVDVDAVLPEIRIH